MQLNLKAGRQRCKVRLNYLGQHNIANALGAAALTLGAGVKLAAVRRGLDKARPFSMRMQIEDWRGISIINDTYNANPASMKAALRNARGDCPAAAARIAVLGDMFELGKHSAQGTPPIGQSRSRAARRCSVSSRRRKPTQVRRGALAAGMSPERDHHRQGSCRSGQAFARAA